MTNDHSEHLATNLNTLTRIPGLTGVGFSTFLQLDHAAKIKSPAEAEKYYGETKTVLGDVLTKLG
jgi:hypothetical protein